MKELEIYTDGACSGNPGPGGYGVVMIYQCNRCELSAGFRHTTNNRMEIMGAIAGLEALKEPCTVSLYSDSKYLVDAMSKGWVLQWRANGWRRSDKKQALNIDLWGRLLELTVKHMVTFHWVAGHGGHPENERCDALARAAIEQKDELLEDMPLDAAQLSLFGMTYAKASTPNSAKNSIPQAPNPTHSRLAVPNSTLKTHTNPAQAQAPPNPPPPPNQPLRGDM